MNPLPLNRRRKETILRYLLNDYQFKKWRLEKESLSPVLEEKITLRQLIGFLYTIFSQKYSKCICGEKNPSFIRKLSLLCEVYPRAKFIHIVRDGRDIYLSLKNRLHYSASSLAVSSFEWNIKLSLIHRALKKEKNRVFEIRYEDMVREPVSHIKKVCSFLNVTFEEEMLNFWKQSEKYIDRQHSELIFKPVEPANAFKWKNNLSSSDLKKYEFFSYQNLKRYGYIALDKPIRVQDKVAYIAELIIYLPKRILRMIYIMFYMRLASKFGLKLSHKYYE
jgi:hypothetical protein